MPRDAEHDALEPLTPREQEVLELLRLGLPDAEIAGRLDVSTAAIRRHVSQIIGKLGVSNRYEAAAWPERPPWWTTALAPVALFWRKAGAAMPVKPSSVALALSGGLFVAAMVGLGLMALLLLGGEGEAGASLVETETPTAILDPAAPTAAPGGSGGIAVDCAAAVAGIQSECAYPSGATFGVEIHVTQAPEEGYFGFQTKLRWEAAIASYLPSEDPAEEALWPECDLPARQDNQPQGDPSLLFGCVPLSALPEGTTSTGAVLQFRLQCQQEGSTPLVLAPREGDPQGGTSFLNRSLSPIDPVLTSAQVTCGSLPPCPPGGCSTPAPTSTPPPNTTPLPAPTPIPTDTPQPMTPPYPLPTATPQPTPPPPTPTPVPTVTPCPPGLCIAVPFEATEIEADSSSALWLHCLFQAARFSDPSLFLGWSLFAVIGDTAEWERLWNLALERGEKYPSTQCDEIGSAPSLPVDFNTEMTILLVEGYPSGGHLLAIDQVSAAPDRWIVEATRTVPGNDCVVTDAFEYHYRAVKVPRTELPVRLSVVETSYDCST